MHNYKRNEVLSSVERTKIVSTFTCVFSLIYHVAVFFLFWYLKIYEMVYFNVFSVTAFTLILIFTRKVKKYTWLYIISAIEVALHQIYAEYLMGTDTSFHFFILLMGLLPFLIFEDNFKISVPIASFNCLLYIIMDNIKITPVYNFSESIIAVLGLINSLVTIITIIFMILIYTIFVFQIEGHLKRQNDMFDKEIKLASSIQQNFFKQDVSTVKNWDMGFCNQPMTGVTGDLWDIYKTNDNLDGFGIFDVSGHGVSSGLVTMLVKNIIHQEFYNDTKRELWKTLLKINDRVIEEKGEIENYLTGILARIKDENTIEFVNASHPLPLVYRKSTGEIEMLQRRTDSLGAIGIRDFPTFYESQTVTLNPGDELLLYTDGATDSINSEKEEYGIDRLKQSLKNVAECRAEEQIYLLLNDINDFRGKADPRDDITLIIIKK